MVFNSVLLQKPTPKPRQRAAQADKKVSFQDLSAKQMAVSFKYFTRACWSKKDYLCLSMDNL